MSRQSGILFMTNGIDMILGDINWDYCDLVAQQTVIQLHIVMSCQRGNKVL